MEIVRRGRTVGDWKPGPRVPRLVVVWDPAELARSAEPHYGHDGVAALYREGNEVFDDYRIVPEEFIDPAGDGAGLLAGRRARQG